MAFSKIQSINPLIPINQSNRIFIIDSLRGIAVLGILLMNIAGFGLPSVINEDPSQLNETGINYYCWYIFGQGVFEGTFRSIFSMLFGAGTIIYISRMEKRTEDQMPSEMFVRRQLWLLFFGLFNAFILLWYGDILFHYGVCGIILIAFRSLPPRHLLIASAICLLLLTVRSNIDFYNNQKIVDRGEKIEAIDTAIIKLTDNQKAMRSAIEAIKSTSNQAKKQEKIEDELKQYRSGYSQLYKFQRNRTISAETYGLYYFHFFDVLIFMFLGMAFLKLGILQGEGKIRVYMFMAITGLLIGLPLSRVYLHPFIKYHFNSYEILKHTSFEFYELQRFMRSIGIFGLIMLLYKSSFLNRFFIWMQPVGQMAFTNYLTQSFMCGLYFYGCGFGMFGRLQRYELYYVVCLIWFIQILWSNIWLRYFCFGPFEWLWRSLTYWKIQPFRK